MKKLWSIIKILIIAAVIAGCVFFASNYATKVDMVLAMYDVWKGDRAYKNKQLWNAIAHYKDALDLYPEHYRAWYNLGNIYVVYEDYEAAVEAYEKAFTIKPDFLMARMNYGVLSSEKLGEFDDAIEQYEAIIATEPKLFNIPLIFNNKKSTKLNKGLAHYNAGVALKNKWLYESDGDELKRKYLETALKAYEEAVKILKKDYDAHYNLALTNHLLKNYRAAGRNYCKAIEFSPMSYEAHYNLAILLRQMKFYREALDEMEKANTLITDSEGITNRQRYVFDVMNRLTGMIYSDEEVGGSFGGKLATAEEPAGTRGITYVNGRMVATAALDEAMLKNFKTCGSLKIFLEDADEDELRAEQVKRYAPRKRLKNKR